MYIRTLKIYLAGAMGGLSYDEYMGWRQEISDKIFLYRVVHDCHDCVNKCVKSVDIINPADYYNFEHPRHASEREVMKFDLRHVKSSDLIIVNFNSSVSQGTTAELAVAHDHDIPIIGVNADKLSLHPWDEAFCDRIFDSMDEAVEYIGDFYLR